MPKKAVKTAARNGREPPNIVRKKPFSWDELMKYRDRSTPEEAEAFVRLIHDLRRQSLPRTRRK
ncbi:MAG: hypothetical protein HYR60_18035 [Acidobacteria bacterium]|nr:hypothetical protein [Acidobacteriota bacterium]